ncbi:MAG: hypothetical protein FWG89_01495 [Treponema sp.]|nr:hypothetical protein [Treponema sp.]
MNKDIFLRKAIGIIILLVLLFFVSPIIFRVYQIEILPLQIFGALIGVFITSIITWVLLYGQTKASEKREKNVKIFEKKQEVYHDFLLNLNKIIQDGEITISVQNEDSKENVDEFKDLLFQMGYIQMHTSEKNKKKIFETVFNIIKEMNRFNSLGNSKQNDIPNFYANLAEYIFDIVSVFKNDLYDEEKTRIKKEEKNNFLTKEDIKDNLDKCNLFIQNVNFDRYELQKYFWDELQNQLLKLNKDYINEVKDFTLDIQKYYNKKPRHMHYGINFPVYTMQDQEKVYFHLNIENDYYYGFTDKENLNSNPKIPQICKQVDKGFEKNKWWYGWKHSDCYNLDFWNLNSESFNRLKHPNYSEKLIKEIAEEIDSHIKKFKEIAAKNSI